MINGHFTLAKKNLLRIIVNDVVVVAFFILCTLTWNLKLKLCSHKIINKKKLLEKFTRKCALIKANFI